MKRPNPYFVSLIATGITSILLLGATGATASTVKGYQAKPVATAEAGKFVVRDTVWNCGAQGCASASKLTSRPSVVCEALVKEIGAVASFRAGSVELDAEALAKCNARARGNAAALARAE